MVLIVLSRLFPGAVPGRRAAGLAAPARAAAVFAATAIAFTALLSSCATTVEREPPRDLGTRLEPARPVPVPSSPGSGRFDRLGEGALLYGWTDLSESRELFKEALRPLFASDDRLFDRALSSAREAVFAVHAGTKEDTGQFVCDVSGKWPAFGMAFSMTLSREWKKVKEAGAIPFWQGKQVSLRYDERALLASSTPSFPPPASIGLPRYVAALPAHSDLALWIPEPSSLLEEKGAEDNAVMDLLFSRVDSLILSMDRLADGSWSSSLRIPLSSAREARALATILKMALRSIAFTAPGALAVPGPSETGAMDSKPGFLVSLITLYADSELSLEDASIILENRSTRDELSSLLSAMVSVYFGR